MKTIGNVSLRGISKEYTLLEKKFTVLKDLNIDIYDKNITVILGKSGCGKTTLLRIISGLEKQTRGEILVPSSKGKIGFVFQESRLMPWLTVRENIAFSSENKNVDDALLYKYLDIMGLKDFENAYPNQISGGMAQRVAIARTLYYNPDIILMDEPFSALDYFTRKHLQEEIIKIFMMEKKNIIFVTHNVDEAIYLGGDIIILSEGQVLKKYSLKEYKYPRDLISKEFIDIKEDILNTLCEI